MTILLGLTDFISSSQIEGFSQLLRVMFIIICHWNCNILRLLLMNSINNIYCSCEYFSKHNRYGLKVSPTIFSDVQTFKHLCILKVNSSHRCYCIHAPNTPNTQHIFSIYGIYLIRYAVYSSLVPALHIQIDIHNGNELQRSKIAIRYNNMTSIPQSHRITNIHGWSMALWFDSL